VIYGVTNADNITDEDGVVPEATDVTDVPAGTTIERTAATVNGAWRAAAAPNPGDCTALSN
jgi:hypothetical protein